MRSIPKPIRKVILAEQGGKCAGTIPWYKCPLRNYKLRLDECQTDHIVEYALTRDNRRENLQVLCHMCHAIKTLRFNRKNMTGRIRFSSEEKSFLRS